MFYVTDMHAIRQGAVEDTPVTAAQVPTALLIWSCALPAPASYENKGPGSSSGRAVGDQSTQFFFFFSLSFALTDKSVPRKTEGR